MNVDEINPLTQDEPHQLTHGCGKENDKNQQADRRMPIAKWHLQPKLESSEPGPGGFSLQDYRCGRVKEQDMMPVAAQMRREIADDRCNAPDLLVMRNYE